MPLWEDTGTHIQKLIQIFVMPQPINTAVDFFLNNLYISKQGQFLFIIFEKRSLQ